MSLRWCLPPNFQILFQWIEITLLIHCVFRYQRHFGILKWIWNYFCHKKWLLTTFYWQLFLIGISPTVMQINLKVAKEDDKKNISLAKKLNPHKISKDFEQIRLTIWLIMTSLISTFWGLNGSHAVVPMELVIGRGTLLSHQGGRHGSEVGCGNDSCPRTGPLLSGLSQIPDRFINSDQLFH